MLTESDSQTALQKLGGLPVSESITNSMSNSELVMMPMAKLAKARRIPSVSSARSLRASTAKSLRASNAISHRLSTARTLGASMAMAPWIRPASVFDQDGTTSAEPPSSSRRGICLSHSLSTFLTCSYPYRIQCLFSANVAVCSSRPFRSLQLAVP